MGKLMESFSKTWKVLRQSLSSLILQKEKESFVTMRRKIHVIEKIKETIVVIAKKRR